MGRFSRLLQAKGKDVTVGDEVFNIKPLASKYLGLFMDVKDSEQAEAMFQLVQISLQQTDKSITIDDVKEIPIKDINKIVEVIMEVNELKE